MTRLRMELYCADSPSASGSAKPSWLPPLEMTLEPTLEVQMSSVFLKDTTRPCESVSRPSSSTYGGHIQRITLGSTDSRLFGLAAQKPSHGIHKPNVA